MIARPVEDELPFRELTVGQGAGLRQTAAIQQGLGVVHSHGAQQRGTAQQLVHRDLKQLGKAHQRGQIGFPLAGLILRNVVLALFQGTTQLFLGHAALNPVNTQVFSEGHDAYTCLSFMLIVL